MTTTMIKLVGEKNGCKKGYLQSLKVSTHKMLFNYKRKERTLQ